MQLSNEVLSKCDNGDMDDSLVDSYFDSTKFTKYFVVKDGKSVDFEMIVLNETLEKEKHVKCFPTIRSLIKYERKKTRETVWICAITVAVFVFLLGLGLGLKAAKEETNTDNIKNVDVQEVEILE